MSFSSARLTKVYIDTSLVVALYDPEDEFRSVTTNFVSNLRKKSVPLSIGPPFLLEVAKAAEQRGTVIASRLASAIEEYGIELVGVTDESLWNLESAYASSRVLGQKRTFDLLHYASATLLGCSHLASWDRRHFNGRIGKRVDRVNASRGLTNLIVGDPVSIGRRLGIG